MNNERAEVLYNNLLVGILYKENNQYYFQYNDAYILDPATPQISLSFPKQKEPFVSDFIFPFFYGLLAEGDNKELQCRELKIDENDHFKRLIKTAGMDTIGGITVREI